MIHLIKYLKMEIAARETATFYFEKPNDFTYTAGQFGDFSHINPPETDAKGNSRAFSLASAPSEESIMIATRLRDSAFKRVLRGLKPGQELIFDAPLGKLTLPEDFSHPIVLLAGGIGITPFRSMIIEASTKNLPYKIYLFYSNKTPADAPFLEELKELEKKNKNFKLIPTMTQLNDSAANWSGETNYLDAPFLKKYLGDLNGPIYYLAGPPAMIQALYKVLVDSGVNKNDIRLEEFIGY